MHRPILLAGLLAGLAAGLSGTVIDAVTRQPVPFAEVSVPDRADAAVADSLGRFSLDVPSGPIQLRATRIGYETALVALPADAGPVRLLLTPRSITLRGITVSAFRTPLARHQSGPVTVFDGTNIERPGSASLAEVLGSDPGAGLRDYGNLTTLGIRGANAEQSLVLLDGIPLNSAQDNLIDVSTLSPLLARRVELARSGVSALYGANSSGGVAAIITPEPESLGARLDAGLAAFGRRYVRLRHTNVSGPLGYYIAGELDGSPNRYRWRDSLDSLHTRDNSALASSGGIVKLSFCEGPHAASLLGEYSARRRGSPGPITSPSDSAQLAETRGIGQVRYGWQQSGSARLEATAWHHETWRNYEDPGPLFQSNDTHAAVRNGASVTENLYLGQSISLLAAADADREELAGTGVRAARRDNLGLAVQARAERYGVTMIPGFRLDLTDEIGRRDSAQHRTTRAVPSPRVWLTWSPARFATIYAGLGRSFRAPTFNELYWPEGPWTGGNPRLEPEWATNVDAGFTAAWSEHLHGGIGFFHNRYTNLIQWQPDSAFVYRPVNLDSATVTGVELEFASRFRYGGVEASMTWLAARSGDADLIYRPRLAVGVRHWLEWRRARLGWNVQSVGTRFADPANADTLPAWLTLDLEARFAPRVGRIQTGASAGVRNLFDRSYEMMKGYPLPGRNWYVEVELGL